MNMKIYDVVAHRSFEIDDKDTIDYCFKTYDHVGSKHEDYCICIGINGRQFIVTPKTFDKLFKRFSLNKPCPLVWNIMIEDFNHGHKIIAYNIFNHASFLHDIRKINFEIEDREEFFKEILHVLQYYFWAKCEYEVLVGSMFDNTFRKIDGWDQIQLNLPSFKEFILDNRNKI